MKIFFIALILSGVVFILLINVTMSTFVGIITFMNRIKCMLIFEYEQSYNLRPKFSNDIAHLLHDYTH